MRNSSLTRFLLHKTSRTFHRIANVPTEPRDVSKWKAALREELASRAPVNRGDACIHRVPVNMRALQPDAYAPSVISIGPYHHGHERLQEMEELKWEFFHRLFRPQRPNGVELDPAMEAMEVLEQDARGCYWDKAERLGKDEFVRMMLVDGCFVVELLRELKHNNFRYAPSVKRWMLSTLRQDLIMLENQLPLSVLQKLFELTKRSEESTSTTCLEELALRFFNPLLQSQISNVRGVSTHFLDLFRLSILPTRLLSEQGVESRMSSSNATKDVAEEGTGLMRSTTELMEAGVVFEKAINCPMLDVRSDKRWLKIPPLCIDDHKGTLIRNMVAYEQCHTGCEPHVTSYLFFFDGLINSAHDVELLHRKGILHHSLGSNKEVAKLVNGLCKEIARDGRESYLRQVVHDVDTYWNSRYAWFRAGLVHHYFSSWMVGVSTLGAIIVLYLTLIQTGFGFVGDHKNLEKPFHHYLMHCLVMPLSHLLTFIQTPVDDDENRLWLFSV